MKSDWCVTLMITRVPLDTNSSWEALSSYSCWRNSLSSHYPPVRLNMLQHHSVWTMQSSSEDCYRSRSAHKLNRSRFKLKTSHLSSLLRIWYITRGANTLMWGSTQSENISRMKRCELFICKVMTKLRIFSLRHCQSYYLRITNRCSGWWIYMTWVWGKMLGVVSSKSWSSKDHELKNPTTSITPDSKKRQR
jgi:hypothetical protein